MATTIAPAPPNVVTDAPISEQVARGIALLDEKRPGWEWRINLETLDLGEPCRCTLGQLYFDYGDGCRELGLNGYAAVEHGFYVRTGWDEDWDDTWDALTAEWRRAILALRDERDPDRAAARRAD